MSSPDAPFRDATFAEGAPDQPLALRAETPEDLPVLAALTQDAVLTVGDIRHDPRTRRLTLLLNRFRWEDAEAARAEARPYERVRAILSISDALRVKSDGIARQDRETVLSLLDLAWQPGPDGTGRLVLTFAGDGALAVEAECLSVDLRDVTRPYRAISGQMPRHDEA